MKSVDKPLENSLLLWGEVNESFVLFGCLAGWMRPTHIVEGSLLSSKGYFRSENILTETSRIMFDQMSGHHGPGKWTHEINHHNRFLSASRLNMIHLHQVKFTIWGR